MSQTISHVELFEKLLNVKGATFATITTETIPTMRKKNNPYVGRVVKRSIMNVTMNFIYANSVNNQRTKEGITEEFVPHERRWGKRIQGTTLVEHEKDGITNYYVEAKPNAAPQSVVYLLDGEEIDKSLIAEFLPEVKESNTQGVEKEIIVRDFAIHSIKEIKMQKEHFILN